MNLAFFRSAALLALFVAGCADNTAVTPPGRTDAGFDAAMPEDASTPDDSATPEDASTPVDAATPEDAATPVDAGTPVDAATPVDAGTPDAGTADAGPADAGTVDAGPPDAGPIDSGAPAVCPFGDVPVCSANVAGGTQAECTANLTRLVNICRAAGWLWTGETACVMGGSPSCVTCFGGDGTCSH